MIKVTKSASPPPALRQAYLESLAEPQELYLEEQVNAGKTLTIGDEAYERSSMVIADVRSTFQLNSHYSLPFAIIRPSRF